MATTDDDTRTLLQIIYVNFNSRPFGDCLAVEEENKCRRQLMRALKTPKRCTSCRVIVRIVPPILQHLREADHNRLCSQTINQVCLSNKASFFSASGAPNPELFPRSGAAPDYDLRGSV